MKKRLCGLFAALLASSVVAVAASAEEVSYEVMGYTFVVGDIVTADGYDSFTYAMTGSDGTTMLYEYFFTEGSTVEYSTLTFVLPEGCTADDFETYVMGYTLEDVEAVNDTTYRVPGTMGVTGMEGTAEEARNYLIEQGTGASDMTEDEIADAIEDGFDELGDSITGAFEDEGTTGENAADDSTAEDASTGDSVADDKASPDTGVGGIAAMVGLAISAVGVALLSKKPE